MIKGEHSFLQHIQTIFESGTIAALTDQQLLEGFAGRDGEPTELCFDALIKRHGPMVLRTCQAILHDRHDAEDAFQATFLVLARKARSLWVRESLGPWLFEVACRVAACARSATARRRFHERRAAGMAASIEQHTAGDDRGGVLCEELNRLPDQFRAALVLCDLEGLTQERAAQILGWPAGTVRSRLARGRQRLRDRLTRRGLAPSVVPALQWLAADAPMAPLQASLAEITTQRAVQFLSSRAVTGTTASVGSLAEGALRIMFLSKLKLIAAGALAGGLLAGTTLLAYWSEVRQKDRPPAAQADAPAKESGEVKPRPGAPASADAQPLSANARARLDVAKKLRHAILERCKIDPSASFGDYLTGQNRLDEVIAEVLVKTDADRVRFLEHRLATLERIEHFIGELQKNGFISPIEPLSAELYRREAEDRLEKARAKLGANGAAPAGPASAELVEFLNQDSWDPSIRVPGRPAAQP
jgi:RNA polymerase sigma factor (sigma-70 family)